MRACRNVRTSSNCWSRRTTDAVSSKTKYRGSTLTAEGERSRVTRFETSAATQASAASAISDGGAPRSTALASAEAFAAANLRATSRPKSTAQLAVASSTAGESHEALNEDRSASPLVDSNARAQRAKSTAGAVRASDRRTASRRSPALARASTL